MDRAFKHELVSELKQVFQDANIVIVTQNKSLTVEDSNKLRRNIKQSHGKFKVAKNRLVKIALKDSKFSNLTDLMTGPTGIAYSDDPVATAKIINDFAKDNAKLSISGGIMGDTYLTPDQIKQLADLPSLDQLRGKIIGLVQATATKIAVVLQAPGTQIVRVIDANVKKTN